MKRPHHFWPPSHNLSDLKELRALAQSASRTVLEETVTSTVPPSPTLVYGARGPTCADEEESCVSTEDSGVGELECWRQKLRVTTPDAHPAPALHIPQPETTLSP